MTDKIEDKGYTSFTRGRLFVALLIAFFGCVFIWIATPYNNFVLKNGLISDDYLMPSVLAVLLVTVLVINPALRIVRKGWSLNFKQIALITGLLFIGASITSNGLLRVMPYGLARQVSDASERKETAENYESADLPPSLFPGKLGYGEDIEDVRNFLVKLPDGEAIPWGTWLAPAISWLVFFLFFWVMCIGLAGIMLPQWQQTERLAFPLTRILQTLMETPGEERLLPPIFRDKAFWIAALAVILIHSLAGLDTYFPGRVPVFGTKWSLAQILTEEPWNHLPAYMKGGKFYFTFIGVAYFMPTRVSFSIWFFMIAYAIYSLIGQTYFPPFHGQAPAHRSGALLAMTLTILWLGRGRLLHVLRCAVYPAGTARTDADQRDRSYFYLFWLGIFGMCGWMIWIGVQVPWAVMLAAIICIYQLVVMRIVAEAGLPVAGLGDAHFRHFFRLIPIQWINGATAWFAGAMSCVLGGSGTRSSLATFAMQSMSLDEKASPRRQWKTARYYVIVLIVSFFACGAAHIFFSYQYSQTLDSKPESPISKDGSYRLHVAASMLHDQVRGARYPYPYNLPAHIAFGAVLTAGLQYACLIMPRWPLHPVGVILVYTWWGQTVWISVAIGWLLQKVVAMFGGVRLYRRLRPAFIGLIIGESIAAIIWFSLSGILGLSGRAYEVIPILPI